MCNYTMFSYAYTVWFGFYLNFNLMKIDQLYRVEVAWKNVPEIQDLAFNLPQDWFFMCFSKLGPTTFLREK